ncbi:hypothetical protein B0H17DRAFT_1107327 [Mycena rosella]|uniref:Uncharacterized protein n=1 Tax=Mycena rosella TaxID=1033263 RepID=A0AAD7FRX8_MYCRO|nr:hypothetical protein B0H17DRAFT_1107327 [Mycena rosella]
MRARPTRGVRLHLVQLQSPECRLQTADCGIQTQGCKFQTPECRYTGRAECRGRLARVECGMGRAEGRGRRQRNRHPSYFSSRAEFETRGWMGLGQTALRVIVGGRSKTRSNLKGRCD